MQQKKREERYPKKYTEAEPGRERGGWLIKANDLEQFSRTIQSTYISNP